MQSIGEFVSKAHTDSEILAKRAVDFGDVIEKRQTITPPRTLWNSKHARRPDGTAFDFDLKIEACGIHVLSGCDLRTHLRTSLSIACGIALSSFEAEPDANTFGRLGIAADGRLERRPDTRTIRPNVLYINTLQSEQKVGYELHEMWRDMSARGQAVDPKQIGRSLQLVTMSPGEIVDRMKQLRSLIYERNIHVLMINSLEFAYRTARQKSAFVNALQELRESLKVTIVLSTFEPVPKPEAKMPRGSIGKLFGSATSVVAIGDADAGRHPSETEFEYALRKRRTGPIRTTTVASLMGFNALEELVEEPAVEASPSGEGDLLKQELVSSL